MNKSPDPFSGLVTRNVITWTTLISGYARHGHVDEALTCYNQMQIEGIFPNAFTIASTFKACGIRGNMYKGKEIHAKVVKECFLQKDALVATALMDMYCKCGELSNACEVFDGFPSRDVVMWTALIAGYVENKNNAVAYDSFNRMHCEGLCGNAFTLSCTLKACAGIKATDKGKMIHMRMVEDRRLNNATFVTNALVDMYVKNGSCTKAQEVFDKLLARDIVSWNVIISGYSQHGKGGKALDCFKQMQEECHLPNEVTFLCTLKACTCTESLKEGKQIHAQVAEEELLQRDILISNALIDMYAKHCALAKAEEVFDQCPVRNVATWNALMTGYSQHGYAEETLYCFQWMNCEGFRPNEVTFVCVLKACGSLGFENIGNEIYYEVTKEGLIGNDDLIGNALVDMYAKCGAFSKAREVFGRLKAHTVISWTALISGYANYGHGWEALQCFDEMQQDGFCPNFITFLCILKACSSLEVDGNGKKTYHRNPIEDFLGKDSMIRNALVDMYEKCGALGTAQAVFQGLRARDVASWNTLLLVYVQHGYDEEVLSCFESMKLDSMFVDAITFSSVLRACGNIRAVNKGREIHADIVMLGSPENVVGSSLVDMYVRCGALDEAHAVTDRLEVCDVYSLAALISGYVQQGLGEDALNVFEKMKGSRCSPDASMFIWILKACGIAGATGKAQGVHAEIGRAGLLEKNILIGSSLVDMYAKCGASEKAHEVFNKLPVRDVVCWTALITGYSQVGKDAMAISLFSEMVLAGIEPNAVVLTVLLNACSHCGLVDEAQTFFQTMSSSYGILPNLEHWLCMIDVFGRSGHFNKALIIIEKMPVLDTLAVWTALMGACQKWGNLELARLASANAVQHSDGNCTSVHVCMRNICAASTI